MKTEHEEQREFVQWFRQTQGDVRIHSVPNGGARNIITASAMKAEGVSPGVPDLFAPEWKLWIEMKRTGGGIVSPAQKDWMKYLIGVGYDIIVGWGRNDAINKVEEWKGEAGARNKKEMLRNAAPDMLEALQMLVDEQVGPPLVRRTKEWENAMDKARRAIDKAIGVG